MDDIADNAAINITCSHARVKSRTYLERTIWRIEREGMDAISVSVTHESSLISETKNKGWIRSFTNAECRNIMNLCISVFLLFFLSIRVHMHVI